MEAEELGVQVMEIRKKVLGQEHPDTLTSINNLASKFRHQGRLTEAEEPFVQEIETFHWVIGQDGNSATAFTIDPRRLPVFNGERAMQAVGYFINDLHIHIP
jgi:hypothetical protein